MNYLVALLAILMPVVAGLSNAGVFGPTNAEISNQYPTLIVAAGYAFAIWGPIFVLNVAYAIWQVSNRSEEARNRAVRPFAAIAFAMSSAWMIVFSLELFWLALAIIWVSLVCVWYAAWRYATRAWPRRTLWWGWLPLSLHAGWVSLAAFLNIAQVIVAFELLSTTHMLAWTRVLFVLLAALLLVSIARMRGNVWYALAAVWGLVAVYQKQSAWDLHGASSTKGFTGHTLGAAGAVEAVLTLLALKHHLLPGNVGCATPDPACAPQLALETCDQALGAALSNSFGFGGNNVCLAFARGRIRA